MSAQRRADLAPHVEAVHAQHVQVEQHQVDVTPMPHLKARRTGGSLEHLEALTGVDLTQQTTDLRVIIDEQW